MESLKFAEKIIINQAPSLIFDYTQDYNSRLKWDTFLKEARLINGATEAGKGVRAWCVAHNGLGMETEYVSYNRPKVTAIKMTKGPYWFRSFSGSWNFKELEANETEVLFMYSFQLRFPFNLFKSQIKRILQNNVKQRLNDLKRAVEALPL
ncbi:SRPBCC family protein [Mucilaginibacter achroorhodeus]|uniref:SRPBCC family protein n=1 Tax=Mucilaginibacter achroorhodeus TaxID=2599294 RepID=A0A563U5Q3_9SPHI|nr:SRPBCC family protein [Mucilaginibacter achroorhodeus]TWR26652.1 SRPBCC family protein [Mucilaginibacter achroorhodeus]